MADTANVMLTPYEADKQVQTARIEMTALQDTIRAASEEMVAASKQPGFVPGTGKTALQLTTEAQGQLQAQQLTQRVAAATDFERAAVEFGQQLTELSRKRQQLDAKIAQDSSVSLWEDPLTALANAFTLPWDEQERDAVNQQITHTADSLGKIHSHVQQSAKTADDIATKVTDASVASIATATERLAMQQAAEARMKAAQSQGDMIAKVMNMDEQRVRLYIQQKQLQHTEASERRQAAEHDLRMQELQLRQKEFQKKEDLDKFQLQMANLALAAEGQNPLDDVRLNNLKGLNATRAQALIDQGMAIAASGDRNVSYGQTVDSRLKRMAELRWQAKTPQQQTVVDWMTAAERKAAEAGTNKSLMTVNKELELKKRIEEEERNIREGSPFEAPAYTVLAKSAAIKNNPIWQEYVLPLLDPTSVRNATKPEIIISAAEKALADRKVTATQAANFVSTVFSQSVAINNTVHQFKKVLNREQTQYGYALDLGTGMMNTLTAGLISSKQRIDLTDPVKVQYALQQRYTSWVRQGAGSEIGPFGMPLPNVAPGPFRGAIPEVTIPDIPLPSAVPFPNLPAQFQGVQTYEQRTGAPFYSTLKPVDAAVDAVKNMPGSAHEAMGRTYGVKK